MESSTRKVVQHRRRRVSESSYFTMKLIGCLGYKAICSLQLSGFKTQSAFQLSSAKLLLTGTQLESFLVPSWVLARQPWVGKEFGNKRLYKSAPLQERKMVDRRRVHVKGGDGGDGCSSFRRSRHDRHGEADGGRGGRGGDVIFECSEEFWDFSHLQHNYNAKNGGMGSSKKRVGSRGPDKIVRVPMGTVIHLVSGEIPSLPEDSLESKNDHLQINESGSYVVHESENLQMEEVARNSPTISEKGEEISDKNLVQEHDEDEDVSGRSSTETESEKCSDSSGTEMEDDDTEDEESEQDSSKDDSLQVAQRFVAELVKYGETLTVACGGEGGRGNAAMARGRGSKKQLPSRAHEEGHSGTQAFLLLELKTIADVGFVGAPNAGKSTLLGAISRAKPKVGHYAFTTLRPNLGKLEFEDFLSITVADIPGLIKGAHRNVGLGHDFLRHIERTKVLAYVVDLAACVGDNKGFPPWVQYEDLKFELEMYQSGLSNRPSLIVATKLDEKGAVEALQELKSRLPSMQILPVCAVLEQGIHELKVALRELVTSEKY